MVDLLIEENANVNLRNNIGWTPIFAAARFGIQLLFLNCYLFLFYKKNIYTQGKRRLWKS